MTSVLMFYKEVRDHQRELKDKCTSKQCVENKEAKPNVELNTS